MVIICKGNFLGAVDFIKFLKVQFAVADHRNIQVLKVKALLAFA